MFFYKQELSVFFNNSCDSDVSSPSGHKAAPWKRMHYCIKFWGVWLCEGQDFFDSVNNRDFKKESSGINKGKTLKFSLLNKVIG